MKTDIIMRVLADLRPVDADRVDEWFPASQRETLLHEITGAARPASSGSPRGRRLQRRSGRRSRSSHVRPRALFSVAGALAVVAVVLVLGLGSAVQPQPARAAVAFSSAANGDIIATITDPFAAETQLDAAFAAHGFHITVSLVPVSPSLVGTVVYMSDDGGSGQIESLEGGSCVTGGGGCPVGLKIPAAFTGQGYITLGRPAQSGETYESAASAFATGEALHCSGLLGAQVGAAMPVLDAHKLTVVQWRVGQQVVSTAPAENYIWQIDPVAAGTVRVWTESTAPSDTSASAAYDTGCETG